MRWHLYVLSLSVQSIHAPKTTLLSSHRVIYCPCWYPKKFKNIPDICKTRMPKSTKVLGNKYKEPALMKYPFLFRAKFALLFNLVDHLCCYYLEF